MLDDKKHSPQGQVTSQDELSEDLPAVPGIADPVIGPAEFIKVKKWYINLVFCFLAFIAIICLAAVAIKSNPVMQVTALGVWTGSVALARFLLTGASRKKRKHR